VVVFRDGESRVVIGGFRTAEEECALLGGEGEGILADTGVGEG
jgi:hypothetical protein